MPSSNFWRSRWLPYLVTATALGAISPIVSGYLDFAEPASRHGLLYWWFVGMPVAVDLWVWPSEEAQYALWAAVFTLQYFVVLAAGGTFVMLLQRRGGPPEPPPESERAFEEAATLYHLRDNA